MRENVKVITDEYLKSINCCKHGYRWWIQRNRPSNSVTMMNMLIQENLLEDANWFISRVLKPNYKIEYGKFAVGNVLHVFESKYPTDDRPRKAILQDDNFQYLSEQSTKAAVLSEEPAKHVAIGAANFSRARYALSENNLEHTSDMISECVLCSLKSIPESGRINSLRTITYYGLTLLQSN